MTFPAAQTLRNEYLFLIGQKALNYDAVITAIIIKKVDNDYNVIAFYYKGGSEVGEDDVELYKNRKI